MNLKYVALTRSTDTLILLSKEPRTEADDDE